MDTQVADHPEQETHNRVVGEQKATGRLTGTGIKAPPGRRSRRFRVGIVAVILVMAVISGIMVAEAAGLMGVQKHVSHRAVTVPRGHHRPTGYWIIDDKGGMEYIPYGRMRSR